MTGLPAVMFVALSVIGLVILAFEVAILYSIHLKPHPQRVEYIFPDKDYL